MANYEMANSTDEQLFNNLWNSQRYQTLKNYDIHVKLFYKYSNKDKDGNIKTPALSKFGISIPAQIKVVSNFNRLTDDIDVKIILNKEHWDELSTDEKKSTLDNMLHYLQVKEDKIGEPLTISEDSDKVQLKLKHPDFYCEGFLDLLKHYKKNYLPYKDAQTILKNTQEE